jgi:phytoene synthase
LLAFDARLALLVSTASEPMIGQLKLAWWRDAIAMQPDMRPKGEPLLRQLAVLDKPDVGLAMSQLVDAWETLLVAEDSAAALAAFAKERGAAIFGSYAVWVGSDVDVKALGAIWAVADLTGDVAQGSPKIYERKLRPLTILALSVRDVSGPRLLWHALTGR